MKRVSQPRLVTAALLGLLPALPLAAQSLTLGGESEVGLPAETLPAPAESTAPVADAPAAPAQEARPALPLPEQRLREGLVMLTALHDTMAHIQDSDSAEAAVAPLMRLHRALGEWVQSFTTLPPLTEQEQQVYEEQYLPLFKKLNARIRTQGERLAAAEYYGSRDLTAALMHIAILNH